MERTIRQSFYYDHPPEVVWEYLTNAELLARWLMPNDLKPEVGHQFRFTAKPLKKMRFDGNIFCEVLEVEPLQRLVYSWKGGPGPGQITLDSVVTWTLTPKGSGTELLLEHSGFRGMKNYLAYLFMGPGWRKIGKRLQQIVKPVAL